MFHPCCYVDTLPVWAWSKKHNIPWTVLKSTLCRASRLLYNNKQNKQRIVNVAIPRSECLKPEDACIKRNLDLLSSNSLLSVLTASCIIYSKNWSLTKPGLAITTHFTMSKLTCRKIPCITFSKNFCRP